MSSKPRPPAAEWSDLIEKGKGPKAGIQIGFRLDGDRQEQLRQITFELRQPVQVILERLLYTWMDRYEEAKRGEG